MENRKQHVALYLIRELTALLRNRAWRAVEKLRREILQLGVEEIVIYTLADMLTVRWLIQQDRWRVHVRVAMVSGREYEKIKNVASGPPRIHLYTDGVSPRNGLRKRGGESLRARLRRARKAGGYRFKGDGSGLKTKVDRPFAAAGFLCGGWNVNKKVQPRKAGGKDDHPFFPAAFSSGGWKLNKKAQPRKETGIRIKEPQYAAPYRRKNNVADPREKGKGKVVEESSSDSSSD